VPSFHAAFTPCVENGWRLAADYCEQGLVTEGAREVVRYGFEILDLSELVSFTASMLLLLPVPFSLPRTLLSKL